MEDLTQVVQEVPEVEAQLTVDQGQLIPEVEVEVTPTVQEVPE